MGSGKSGPVSALLLLLSLAACTGRPPTAAAPGPGGLPPGETAPAPVNRTLTMAYRVEPNTVVPKLATPGGTRDVKRFFNAALSLIDSQGTPQPYLAAVLPQLQTDSWQVAPDGTMATTYRLRPGLTWHDGEPLTADDFVFARRVYGLPGLGFIAVPQNQMDEVVALDPVTVQIRWSGVYIGAGSLADTEFEPLPRHLLEPTLATIEAGSAARETLMNHPYWSTGFVGAGPYRLDRWTPGTEIAGSAFAGHALGRPQIDRMVIRFMGDENAIAANILAEEVQYVGSYSLGFEYAAVLQREWGTSHRGIVPFTADSVAYTEFQFRPDYQKTPALLDVRVRRALAHTIDRRDLREGLFSGAGDLVETLISREMPYYGAVDQAIMKYPFAPRRTEELLGAAGFVKDRDGFYADATGERLAPTFRGLNGAIAERAHLIITDMWRRAGIDIQPVSISVAQISDPEYRSAHPGISISQGNTSEGSHSRFSSAEISIPSRGWRGQNRGGWANADYDALWASFNRTLERDARTTQMIALTKLLSEELPGIFVFADIRVLPYLATLRGPTPGTPDTQTNWNVYAWEWQS
jgi:peptide/nickel transport system substrate-binding protein